MTWPRPTDEGSHSTTSQFTTNTKSTSKVKSRRWRDGMKMSAFELPPSWGARATKRPRSVMRCRPMGCRGGPRGGRVGGEVEIGRLSLSSVSERTAQLSRRAARCVVGATVDPPATAGRPGAPARIRMLDAGLASLLRTYAVPLCWWVWEGRRRAIHL